MQKNLYYHTVLRRRNVLKETILGVFEHFASHPRLSLEVFIRKNPGHRYFKLSSAITVAIILSVFPLIGPKMASLISLMFLGHSGEFGDGGESSGFWGSYATWYLFVIAFVYFSIRRYRESRLPTAWFDATKFSLYSGDIDDRFYSITPFKTAPTLRQVMIFHEPALFCAIGIVLALAGQAVGWLLIVNSLFYSFSYASAFRRGDDLLWDIIDQILLNKNLEEIYVANLSGSKVNYAQMPYMTRPGSEELRRKIVGNLVQNPNEIAVAV